MKIALGQIDMVWEEKEQSFQKAEQMIKEAAKKRADVILFPEMAFTGFSMNIEKDCRTRTGFADKTADGTVCKAISCCNRIRMGSTGKESRPKSEKLLYFVGQRRKRSCTIYEDTSFFLWERRSILSKRERNRNRSFSWQDDRTFYLL